MIIALYERWLDNQAKRFHAIRHKGQTKCYHCDKWSKDDSEHLCACPYSDEDCRLHKWVWNDRA